MAIAAAEVASIDQALGDARNGVAEAEAERQRLAAEGPPAHRRKDLLDKARGPGRGGRCCPGVAAAALEVQAAVAPRLWADAGAGA